MRKRICKKAASLALALAMAVSVCTTALAEDDTEQTTTETTSISEQTKDNGGEDRLSTETVENGATLTLDEFNALTEIPANVTELTVNLDGVDLRNGSFVVGNTDIADHFRCIKNLDDKADNEEVYETRETSNDYIVKTVKAGITLNVVGSIQFEDAKDNPDVSANAITFKIPDASNIVFMGAVLNGGIRLAPTWNESFSSTVRDHSVESVTFDNCTFNGIWQDNGNLKAKSLTIKGCTFNKYDNPASINNSNPIWFKNIRGCDLAIEGNTFYTTRPITLAEQDTTGANIKVINNTFDFSAYDTNTANKAGEPKNDAVMMSTATGGLGNVEISGNTLINANALLSFYTKPTTVTLVEGATFVIKNNTMNGAKASVQYKSAEGYVPDFVTVIKPATVAISTAAPSVRTDGVTDTNLIDAAKTVDISGESVDAVENSDAVVAVKADAEKTYKNEDNTWNEAKLKAALANSALANTDVNKITLVVVPYLAITPKQTDAKDQLTFAIELLCDLRATTDPDNMPPDNTYTISTTNISANAPTVTIQLSVGSAFTADQLTGLYVKHDSTKGVRYYDTTVVNVDNKTIAFENPDGYSDFTVMYSADEAVVDFEGTSKTLNLTSLNDKTLPAPAKTENFLGWQFAGVDGTYTELDEALLAKLAAAYKAAGKPLTATAQYKTVEQPTPAPTEAPV